MGKRIRGLSDWERHKIKQGLLSALRFGATVLASTFLTLWIVERHPNALGRLLPSSARTKRVANVQSAASNPSNGPSARTRGPASSYGRYFEEALPILRADPNVRMVKLEMGSRILSYQEPIGTASDGAPFRLQATSPRIPILAVSRSAQEFLTKMRLAYVDPRSVPADVLKDATPINGPSLSSFLLVPDVTGDQASRFQFSHR